MLKEGHYMKKNKKTFNKGLALLISFVITLMLFMIAPKYPYGIVWLLFLLGAIFSSKKINLKNKGTYLALIFLMPTIGAPIYCYNVMKLQSSKKGMSIDSPKGFLFWLSVLALIILNLYLILSTIIALKDQDISFKLAICLTYIITAFLCAKLFKKNK